MPHHEIAAVLRLLPIDAVPLHPVEIVRLDRGEAGLRVAVNVVDDVEAVLIQLHLLLRSERDETLFDGGEVGRDFGHGGKKGRKSMGVATCFAMLRLMLRCSQELTRSAECADATDAEWAIGVTMTACAAAVDTPSRAARLPALFPQTVVHTSAYETHLPALASARASASSVFAPG